MAHGIGAQRNFGLAPFADRFVSRGLAALVFDYRSFGDSPGRPRCLVSPSRHVEDYRSALAFVREEPRVDGECAALWGTSFSGGHVLLAAAGAPERVRAVVSQVPFVSGIASSLVYPARYILPAFARGLLDLMTVPLGLPPVTVPVVAERGTAVVASPDAPEGYRSLVPEGTSWPGRVPARILVTILGYRPLSSAADVRAPTLMIAARDDAVCPVGAARKAARRIPDCRFEEVPGGHFEPYRGERFDRVSTMEADFLEEALTTAV